MLVDLTEENRQFFTEQLVSLGYDGEIKIFEDLGSAITFLESLRVEDGQKLDHADLILCGYDVERNDGLKMFEKLKQCNNSEGSAISDTTLIKERVVICSAFSLDVFKQHVKK